MRSLRASFGLVFLLIVLVSLLGFVIWGFATAWRLAGNTTMPLLGWIAMIACALLTFSLGGGLMWLAFYSSRKGYDDDVGADESHRVER